MLAQNHKKLSYLVSLLIGISLLLAACAAPAPSPSPTVMAEPPATVAPATTLEPITPADLVGAVWQWAGGPASRPRLRLTWWQDI